MPIRSENELKSCPFCDTAPFVFNSASGKYKTRVIQCANVECDVRPRVFGHSQFEDQLKANVDDVWNTRAAQVITLQGRRDVGDLRKYSDVRDPKQRQSYVAGWNDCLDYLISLETKTMIEDTPPEFVTAMRQRLLGIEND